MWTRAELKSRAWEVLRGSYWKAFLVSIILFIVTASGGSGNNGADQHSSQNNFYAVDNNFSVDFKVSLILGSIFVSIILLVLVFRILLGYQLEVGCQKYFIKASESDANLSYLSYSFSGGRYFNIFVTMLLRSIYLFLWTLLLIIPGIIKSYSYRFVPYILADNPNLSANEAITLSREMADGQKLDMFILDLSFIGWLLLGFVLCVIGVAFVTLPYYYTTMAELYLFLRKSNIDSGAISADMFNLNGNLEPVKP